MNKLRLSTGHEVPLDGDLLAVLEGLYREVTLKRQFKGSFEDMMREIEGLVEQMSPEDRRRYLVESLFLNYNTYESEMLDAYCAAAHREEEGPRPGGGGRAVRRRFAALAVAALLAAAAGRRREARGRPAHPGRAGELRLRQGPAGKDPAQGVHDPQLRGRRAGHRGRLDHLRLHRRPLRAEPRRAGRPDRRCGSRSRPARYSGKVERQVLVRSNDPKTPLVQVRVSATVEPAERAETRSRARVSRAR